MWKHDISKKSLCKFPLMNKTMCWRGYNLPKNTLTGLKRNWAKFCWQMKARCQRTPKHFIHTTVHFANSEAWWHKHHDMGMLLTLWCQVYCKPGIMDQFESIEYLKRFRCLMLKRKCPWNGCFNKTTTPNTPVSSGVTPKMLFLRQNEEMKKSPIVIGWKPEVSRPHAT